MIWLIGNKGALGSRIEAKLKKNKLDYVATDKKLDISMYSNLKKFAADYHFEWIVNCSAYTNVDRAEKEPDIARNINAIGVGNIARIAAKQSARIVHFSCDQIFDGQNSHPINEENPPAPLSFYAKSKKEGEDFLRELWSEHFLFRISWPYGISGRNFVKDLVKRMKSGETLRIVGDQIGSPVYADLLADNMIHLLTMKGNGLFSAGSDDYGTYHYSDDGMISLYDMACAVRDLATEYQLIDNCKVIPISSPELDLAVKRPCYTVLDTSKVKKELDFKVRFWKDNLETFFRQWSEKGFS